MDALRSYPIFPRHFSYEELTGRVTEMAERHSDAVGLSVIGKTVNGREITSVRLTDAKTSDADKQVVVIAAVEHGHERNTAQVAMRTMEWLLDTDDGREILANEIIHVVPVVNIDGYDEEGGLRNANGVNLFCDYSFDGGTPTQPESKALWKLIEKATPDAVVSLHGVSVDEKASRHHRVWESSGVVYSSQYSRCYNRKIINRVNESAAAAGYPQDLGEEDIERILPLIPGRGHHSFPSYELGATLLDACYDSFHSLGITFEIGAVESGVVRLLEFLKIGTETWEYECFKGYPNRIITSPGTAAFVLAAGGETASERRGNRVRLWRFSGNIMTGMSPYHHKSFRTVFFSFLEEDDIHKHEWRNAAAFADYLEKVEHPGATCLSQLMRKREVGWFEFNWWNDRHRMVEFHRKNPLGDEFPPVTFDPCLKLKTDSLIVSVRFRMDKTAEPTEVAANGERMSKKDCRIWEDERYRYLEMDFDCSSLSRGFATLETTEPRYSNFGI
jgi:hypothetical protein